MTGIIDHRLPCFRTRGRNICVALIVCSSPWAGWDPYWLAVKREPAVKITGRSTWLVSLDPYKR